MYERFTDHARKVMQLAYQEAQRLHHKSVDTDHILLGLVQEGAGVAAVALKNLDIDPDKLRFAVEKIVQSEPDMATRVKSQQTQQVKKVIAAAVAEARQLNHNYANTEHLLLGLLHEPECKAVQVLTNLNLSREVIREEVFHLLSKNIPGYGPRNPLLFQNQTVAFPNDVQARKAVPDAWTEHFSQHKEVKNQKATLLQEWQTDYVIEPSWLVWNDRTVAKMAAVIAAEKRWADLPILADALEEAGCTNAEMLNHCREARAHGSGCWVINVVRATA